MRTQLLVALLTVLALVFAGAANADQAQQVKALVEKAVAMAKKDGIEKTLKAANDRKGPFVKDGVYVVAADMEKNTMLAHPYASSMMIGSDMSDFKDQKGKLIFIEMAKIAKGPGQGWIDYVRRNRRTDKDQAKKGFVMRVPDSTLYFVCGYFVK
jgi:cytochrome c